jgi:MoxR-like ATPase
VATLEGETWSPGEAAQLVHDIGKRIVDNVERVIVGKTPIVQTALATALSGGHLLFEDAPGVGKTVLAKSLARTLGLTFKRIQCTPDLLPTDVTGTSVLNQKTSEFEFRPGPVFANVVLVDELNRATPRTQSSLLECMSEAQITIDNVTHVLEKPFLVMATQNPYEYEGTFALPEAQLDRFAVLLTMGYAAEQEEFSILDAQRHTHPLESLQPAIERAEFLTAMRAVRFIHASDDLRRYVVRLVRATRTHQDVALGASPRAAIAMFQTAQGVSALAGRDYVAPDVVKFLAPFVLEHRLGLKPEARIRGRKASHVVQEILDRTPVPAPGTG